MTRIKGCIPTVTQKLILSWGVLSYRNIVSSETMHPFDSIPLVAYCHAAVAGNTAKNLRVHARIIRIARDSARIIGGVAEIVKDALVETKGGQALESSHVPTS
jgi:hypothetical protein